MRKLVIMAAALVAASSFAQCVPGEEPEEKDCAQVYNVTISVKTTVAKSGSLTTDNGPCLPSDTTNLCYRVKGSKSFKGYYWQCECGCDLFEDNVLDLFNKKTDAFEVYNGTIDWELLQRFGKKNTDVEAAASFEGDTAEFYLMGFGKYDAKKYRVSSISGNVQAFFVAPYCEELCTPGSYAVAYDLCTLEPILTDTIGTGTFSIKYNSSASKKLAVVPDYIDDLLPEAI